MSRSLVIGGVLLIVLAVSAILFLGSNTPNPEVSSLEQPQINLSDVRLDSQGTVAIDVENTGYSGPVQLQLIWNTTSGPIIGGTKTVTVPQGQQKEVVFTADTQRPPGSTAEVKASPKVRGATVYNSGSSGVVSVTLYGITDDSRQEVVTKRIQFGANERKIVEFVEPLPQGVDEWEVEVRG